MSTTDTNTNQTAVRSRIQGVAWFLEVRRRRFGRGRFVRFLGLFSTAP